ncbi:MAG: bifunctional pyr operon transcriptional regulator/uracil phosphoribosyltransferase PyrR [Bacteroidetes bacterium]|nr:bifunctional pyr operon transcriptional regulator/uracil phosphoribosyltransferase PyrR [Bacteroidota bacterium]
MKTILNHTEYLTAVESLAQALLAKHPGLENTALVGVQQGGVVLGWDLVRVLRKEPGLKDLELGLLDITFYRDDFRTSILAPDRMNIPFSIEEKNVILIDDVLFTGRTIKAALDVLLDYGRPQRVELLVLADRKEHRQFPIQADYVGLTIPTTKDQKVKLVSDESGGQNLILRDS